jgi:hypothetical protein
MSKMKKTKPARKKPARKKKAAAASRRGKRTPSASKTSKTKARRSAPKRRSRAARPKARVKPRPKKRAASRGRTRGRTRRREQADLDLAATLDTRGLGPEAGGQSGDTEGVSRAELADSESVEELLEEGQAFEAGVVSGVENAPDADRGPIRTKEVPEDDVPEEYLQKD